MHLSRALLTIITVLCVLPAAASAGEFGRRGFYVGVGGAAGVNFFENEIEDAIEDFLSGTPGVVGSADVGDTWGINARAGYRIFSWFAFEAMYEYMDSFNIDLGVTTPVPGLSASGSLDYTTHTITANLKFIAPIWRIHPYLLLGVGGQYGTWDDETGLINALGGDENGWAFAGRPGVGIDIYLTKNLVLNGEVAGVLAVQDFDAVGTSVQDLFYLSAGAGLQWRF